jgi:hypothetical protein
VNEHDPECGRGILARLKFQAEDADDRRESEKHYAAYKSAVADAKRHFGEWDMDDSVAWAIIAVVQAQNDLAQAICNDSRAGGARREIELAMAARIEAIKALQQAIEEDEDD